jgi:acyl dehydratase
VLPVSPPTQPPTIALNNPASPPAWATSRPPGRNFGTSSAATPGGQALGHPAECVNPMLVLCTAVGMSVEDLSEAGGPFLGVNDCRFERPVYPGDTISCRSTVVAKRESASRPKEGIVTWQTEVTNQRGEVVLTYSRTNLSAKRGGPRVNR